MPTPEVTKQLKIIRDSWNDQRKFYEGFIDLTISMHRDSSKNLHTWIFNIITLSSAIFAFGASALVKSGLVKNLPWIYLGLLCLSFNVLYGLWTMKRLITGEFKALQKLLATQTSQLKKDNKITEELISITDPQQALRLTASASVENSDTFNKIGKPKSNGISASIEILFYVLSTGLLSLMISMIPINCQMKLKKNSEHQLSRNAQSTLEIDFSKFDIYFPESYSNSQP